MIHFDPSFSRNHAAMLVQRIRAYWRRRRAEPKVWIEEDPAFGPDRPLLSVRSNMLNGRPR